MLTGQSSANSYGNRMSLSAIPRLTKVANDAFTSLCKDLHNPDLHFDETARMLLVFL